MPIGGLPLHSPTTTRTTHPRRGRLKDAIAASDATPCPSRPSTTAPSGARKNAIDWASPALGENAFDQIPAAVIAASRGQIGTAMAQQSLRGVLSFCDARQMTAPEDHIRYSEKAVPGGGEIADASTRSCEADVSLGDLGRSRSP